MITKSMQRIADILTQFNVDHYGMSRQAAEADAMERAVAVCRALDGERMLFTGDQTQNARRKRIAAVVALSEAGMNNSEISASLHIPVSTVSAWLRQENKKKQRQTVARFL